MAENRPENILRTLRRTFEKPKWTVSPNDPFKTLIVTIISQNTNNRNTTKAFENLSNKLEITPEALANAQTDQIKQCLKVAGLSNNKARTIKEVSEIILSKYHGNLKSVLSQPLEEARKTLLQLPGVGPKTADVVLLFSARKPTIPVDTHVNRVSRRLGLAPFEGEYEAVRASLQTLYKPKDYSAVHVLLILLGRKYCKARNPQCKLCPVNQLCPSSHLWDSRD